MACTKQKSLRRTSTIEELCFLIIDQVPTDQQEFYIAELNMILILGILVKKLEIELRCETSSRLANVAYDQQ